jgi:hypothetical protein
MAVVDANSASISSAAWRSLRLLEVGVGTEGHVPVGMPGAARDGAQSTPPAMSWVASTFLA